MYFAPDFLIQGQLIILYSLFLLPVRTFEISIISPWLASFPGWRFHIVYFFLCIEAIPYFVHARPTLNYLKFCIFFWHEHKNSSLLMNYSDNLVVYPLPITIVICLFDYLWTLFFSKAKLTGSFAIKFMGSEFNLLFFLLSHLVSLVHTGKISKCVPSKFMPWSQFSHVQKTRSIPNHLGQICRKL